MYPTRMTRMQEAIIPKSESSLLGAFNVRTFGAGERQDKIIQPKTRLPSPFSLVSWCSRRLLYLKQGNITWCREGIFGTDKGQLAKGKAKGTERI